MFYNEAEKFIDDVFWSETHDKSNTLNIPEIVHAKMVRDNDEKSGGDYYGHREVLEHVTSLSKCLRGLAHGRISCKSKLISGCGVSYSTTLLMVSFPMCQKMM